MNTNKNFTRHPDGGKVRTLQTATYNAEGWAVVLTEWQTYRGRTVFEVLRHSPKLGRSFRLDTVRGTEADARKAANAWWLFEQGRGPHPAHGAPVCVGEPLTI